MGARGAGDRGGGAVGWPLSTEERLNLGDAGRPNWRHQLHQFTLHCNGPIERNGKCSIYVLDMTGANTRLARRTAEDLLEDYAVQRPPVDVTDIAEEEGIEVVFATFNRSLADVSGFYDAEERAIYVNEAEHPNRQRFTLAHELGHHFLHREWAASSEYQVLLRSSPAFYDRHEVEANEFAGNLLMPKFLLDEFRHLQIPTLAKLFAVSVPAMKYRLQKAYGD